MHRRKVFQTNLKLNLRIEGGEAFLVNDGQSALIRSFCFHIQLCKNDTPAKKLGCHGIEKNISSAYIN